jgi:4-oxalmesaconate hydratase
MIVDVHGHWTQVPPELDAYRGRQIMQLTKTGPKGDPNISDDLLRKHLQPHLTQMDERGIDHVIFGPRAGLMGHDFGTEAISRNWSEINNDLIYRSVQMYPDRFSPACQLPQSPGVPITNSISELERCAEMGFVSVQINPDPSGGLAPLEQSMGDRSWYPFYEKLVELDMVGLIHAGQTRNPHLNMNASHYVNTDVAAVVELCMSNVLTDFPDIKFVIPHAGGGIPFHWNRMRAIATGAKKVPFEESVRKLYFDLSTYDQESVDLTIKKMGVDNVLYASEMWGSAQFVDPETNKRYDDTVHMVTESDWLSAEDKEKILHTNAQRLYSRAKL